MKDKVGRMARRKARQKNWQRLPIIRKSAANMELSQGSLFYKDENDEKVAIHPFINDSFTMEVATINARLAKHILEHFNANNRSVHSMKTKGFFRAMQSGQWLRTNQGIGFSKDTGMLQDGQHRLQALVSFGEANNPDDLSETSLEMLIISGLDPEVQGVVDKGTNRTLVDTAEISGVLGRNDTEGRLALQLVSSHCLKSESGNGKDSSLATHQDVLDKFECSFGESEETFEEVARRFVRFQKNSLYSIHIGHLSALFEYARYHKDKAEYLAYLTTANTDDIVDLSKSGVDHTFTTDELSSVGAFRKMLRTEAAIKQKARMSHNGGAFSDQYSKTLYLIQQFHGGKKTTRICNRYLRTKSEIKGNKSDYNFHWGLLKADKSNEEN